MYVVYDQHAASEAVPALANNRGLCTVNAYSQIAGEDMSTSAYMLCEAATELYPNKGILPGVHCDRDHYHGILTYLGLEVVHVPNTFGKTITTTVRNMPNDKQYLIYVQKGRHVLPVVYGEAMDWAHNRRFLVEAIYEVKAA